MKTNKHTPGPVCPITDITNLRLYIIGLYNLSRLSLILVYQLRTCLLNVHNDQTEYLVHTVSYLMGTEVSISEVKRPEHKADQSFQVAQSSKATLTPFHMPS
jgi:hypothetical protein